MLILSLLLLATTTFANTEIRVFVQDDPTFPILAESETGLHELYASEYESVSNSI